MTDTRREEIAVKPLEWEWFDAWTWWAETVVGKYRVEERGKQWAWTLNEADSYTHGENEESEFAAKAAAQADYERRILSAITTAPGEQPVTEGSVTKNCTLDPMPREDVKLPPMIGTTEQPSVQEDNETLIDEIEEIISETHDIDVTDRNYAENIVGWLERHHPAALRSLAGDE